MSDQTLTRFIGRYVPVDPETRKPTGSGGYLALLLSGAGFDPVQRTKAIPTLKDLLDLLKRGGKELLVGKGPRNVVDPPIDYIFAGRHSTLLLHLTPLEYDEVNYAQTILSAL